jgi:hypothetical protein
MTLRFLLVALLVAISSTADAAPAPFAKPARDRALTNEQLEAVLRAWGCEVHSLKMVGNDEWEVIEEIIIEDRRGGRPWPITRRFSARSRRAALLALLEQTQRQQRPLILKDGRDR